jgi:bifunctional pyridoxal-dependent enzyme with beta-cystathionase and maltose regulon repressor activities
VSTGATAVGVSLIPKKKVLLFVIQPTKLDILRRSDPFLSTADDVWEIDFNHLARSLTPRTKAIIINSPHNPTGKIFSEYEMTMLRNILHSRKDITIIDDRVY